MSTTLAWTGLALLAACQPELGLERHRFEEVHMGVPFTVTLYAPSEASANEAAAAAFRRIAELDRIMSDYNPESELMRLCRTAGSGEAVPVSPELFFVLSKSQELSRKTGGAFDVTVGPLVRLWRRLRRQKELPAAERLAAARAAVGWEHMQLDPEKRTVRLLKHDMRLDMGGIGAGYALDEAMGILRQHGINRALIDSSGDILAGESPPGESGWKIGVAPLKQADGPPSRYVSLRNAAITTSGDAFQFVEIDGRRYSHLIDPKTGLGLERQSSVTVLAKDGITADSLASAVSVLGPEQGLELIRNTPETEALIVVMRENGPRTFATCGFP